MKYVIRERHFYYDDERWNNEFFSTQDVKMSFSKTIRKVYDDKEAAFSKLIELQAEHFINEIHKYCDRQESSYSFSDEEQDELKKLLGTSIHYADKTERRNRLNSKEKQQSLYQFLLKANINKFELVELNADLLTIYFLPNDNQYAYYDKTTYTLGFGEEEKLLIYQGDEDLFYSDEMYHYHLISDTNCTRLNGKTLNSPLFQSVLTQYADSFNIKSDKEGKFLEINWDNADDNAINSMNAVLDPPWFIPKQVTVEEFLQIQKQVNE